MEIILGEPSRLERLATDIHNHYVASCAGDPDRIQKAMVVCSNRKIAYALLQKFKDKYPEWFEEKKSPDGVSVTEEELKELKPMPFMAMVSSVGSNDEKICMIILAELKMISVQKNWMLLLNRKNQISVLSLL